MKKSMFLLLLIGAFLTSCNQTSSKVEESDVKSDVVDAPQPVNLYTVTEKDIISRKKFELWTKNWTRGNGKVAATNNIRFFNMPIIDLSEVLGELPASSRFYLGLDDTVTPPEPHLMLVGVDKDGNNMIDPLKSQFIFDVTRPCPPSCG